MSTPPGPSQDPNDPRYDPRHYEQPPSGGQEGYPGMPPQGYPQLPGAGYGSPEPPPGDPLVPADLGGWFERIIGVVRRSLVPLLQIQGAFAVVSLVVGLLVGPPLDGAVIDPNTFGSGALGGLLGGLVVGFLILIVAATFAIGASVFVVVRNANGESATIGEALQFAAGRALPLIGWSLLTGLLIGLGTLLLILPGIYLAVVLLATLYGVVLIERGGIGRCFTLVHNRFGATLGRMLLVFLAGLVYFGLVGVILSGLGNGSVAAQVVQAALSLVASVVGVAVYVVTYAELRFREHPGVLTPTLAAELRQSA